MLLTSNNFFVIWIFNKIILCLKTNVFDVKQT